MEYGDQFTHEGMLWEVDAIIDDDTVQAEVIHSDCDDDLGQQALFDVNTIKTMTTAIGSQVRGERCYSQEIRHDILGPMFTIFTELSPDGETLGVEIVDHANEEIIYVNDFDFR